MFDIQSIIQAFAQNMGSRPSGLSPWAIREDAIATSLQQVRLVRSRDVAPSAALPFSRRGESLGRGSFASRIGEIAVVPVLGPLVSRFNHSYWSYDEIVRDLRIAADMPDIRAIILDYDSPGGMVANVESVPAEIMRIRQSKPVVAHIGGLGASAAYWLASAAERVIADRTALVGSVGALIRYVDMEGILTRLGANVVEVIAEQSPNKRLSRDSEDGKAELQAIVDDGAELFLQGLAANRGISRDEIMERYGQGLVFPAAQALERGLIDEIGSFESVLSGLADRGGSITFLAASATAKSQDRGSAMLTLEKLKAENPELVSAIEKDAADKARESMAADLAAAAAAERQRIIGIEEQAAGLTGHDELVSKLKADGKTTPAEAAVQILAAQKAKLATMQAGLQALDNAAAGVESRPSDTGAGNGPVPQTAEGWTAEWNASAKLQDEYPTAAAYVATMKREKRAG